MKRTVRVVADPHAMALATIDRFLDLARAAIMARGRFIVSLAGGSTPQETYRLLATPEWRAKVEWPRLVVLFGDERCVPPDHPDSNFRMVAETLLGHVPIPPDQIMRMRGELAPEAAAAEYEERVSEALGNASIDLALLGLGVDGHTASLFPGTRALHERNAKVVANYVPKLDAWRLTLTAPFLSMARRALFLVTGSDKADALRLALEASRIAVPAQLICAEEVEWLADRAAASAGR